MGLTEAMKAKLANVSLSENKDSAVRARFKKKFNVSDDQLVDFFGQIGQVESKNKNIPQGGGGPGRGFFQFETKKGSGAFQTALNRYENMNKALLGENWEAPGWFKGAKASDNAMLLTRSQQEDILLADLYNKTVDKTPGLGDKLIREAFDTGSVKNLWLRAHWAGAKPGTSAYNLKAKQFDRTVSGYERTKMNKDWSSIEGAFNQMKALDDPFGGRLA
tara:strand:+ start:523 stop:1179 length:657 start_codon:yes stop_codon:yes gene_type:complete